MRYLIIVAGLLFSLTAPPDIWCQPKDQIDAREKCPVCGMFVAKYPAWIAQMQLSNGKVIMFDGVKDMLKYFFEPTKYGHQPGVSIHSIYVRDYYTQEWIDGKKAFYVTGSDVYGPMGHEFIPFSSRDAASIFKQDHQGKNISLFGEIKLEDVENM